MSLERSEREAAIECALIRAFGMLIPQTDLSRVLGLPSAGALYQLQRRGHLGIKPVNLAHRRGKFFSATDIARLLAGAEEKGNE
jgi:hypothetical protein